jgi:hypothetical protein
MIFDILRRQFEKPGDSGILRSVWRQAPLVVRIEPNRMISQRFCHLRCIGERGTHQVEGFAKGASA